ncbi:MAG: UTP--glucose-1-phosphate uridylyltransferase [Actinobacteria bacterium]|nr:UTP--glucose-1-phosphate uridylyltransferase [Actinomycetota bacterium]
MPWSSPVASAAARTVSAAAAVNGDAGPGRSVRKAVIPAAGLGTRFLPATKAIPKEMLPLVDAPAIQYVVEEAVAAGITDVLLVTSPHKKAIEDHFDRSFELEARLAERGRHDDVAELRRLAGLARIHTLRQGEPLGLGHAVHVARHDVLPLVGLVEKPAPDQAPSDLAVIGRYVFTPAVFGHLDGLGQGAGGEIQLTDAMDRLARADGLDGIRCTGGRYDLGAKLDHLRATVDLALRRADLGPAFARYLAEVGGGGPDGSGSGGPPLAS